MLDGIRIIDMTSVIFGPYATQMMADLGAEVIKIEALPHGDISRYLGSAVTDKKMGSTHLTLNRGKKSLALDLKQEEDAATLRQLLEGADIFIHNVRAKAIARLGFDYEAVRAIKADIIYVHGTGFGQNGPYADMPAYDDVIQAASGTTDLLPQTDGNPQPRYLPTVIADKVASHFATQAMLTAIIYKMRTGKGQHVEVPMFECFTSFLLTEHLRDATLVPPLGPAGYPRQLDARLRPLPASDGYFAVVAHNDQATLHLMKMTGCAGLLAHPDYDSKKGRGINLLALFDEIAKHTPAKTVAEWIALCRENDLPAMVARDLDDVVNDPHLKAVDFFRTRTHPDVGSMHEMRPPVRYSAAPARDLGFAPRLNADGDAIKAALQNKTAKGKSI